MAKLTRQVRGGRFVICFHVGRQDPFFFLKIFASSLQFRLLVVLNAANETLQICALSAQFSSDQSY